jgi:hypothetical protein
MNTVFTKVTQVALVADLIQARFKPTVIRTLVSAIANITNTSQISGDGEIASQKRLTIARSLSQVTNLIRGDPEIITNKEKNDLRDVLYSLIRLDGATENNHESLNTN